MPTKLVFNAATQQVEEAELSVDNNGEILVTFADGGFIKLAAGETIERYQELLDLHQVDNLGQISVAKQDALIQALADFNTPTELAAAETAIGQPAPTDAAPTDPTPAPDAAPIAPAPDAPADPVIQPPAQ
jgi:hypothetical protein